MRLAASGLVAGRCEITGLLPNMRKDLNSMFSMKLLVIIAGNDIHSNCEAGIDIRKNADPLVIVSYWYMISLYFEL